MKKLYALTALLLGMTGCSEETITYTNPVPGDEPSGIAAELGIWKSEMALRKSANRGFCLS